MTRPSYGKTLQKTRLMNWYWGGKWIIRNHVKSNLLEAKKLKNGLDMSQSWRDKYREAV